jgi:hypothetical protein
MRSSLLRPRFPPLVLASLILPIFGPLIVPCAFAQAQDPAPGATSPVRPTSGNETQRLSVNPLTGLVTSSKVNYVPLTVEERWKLYWKQNYWSMGAYIGPFAAALVLDQARGDPYQWGGGFPGYGRRVASRVGGAIFQGTFQAPVAALLHEDVRYIAADQRSAKRRALHAVAYSFLTYNNEGHPTLNIANLGGYYAASVISTAWLPGHYNVADHALSDASLQILLSVPVNLLQEFWPEVRSYVFHRH